MNTEEEKKKEHQRQFRWDLLGLITWLLNFSWIRWIFTDIPFRGRRFSRKPPMPGSGGEPPMVSLANLAGEGLKEPEAVLLKKKHVIEEVLSLFVAIALKDGSVSAEEMTLVEEFIAELTSNNVTVDELGAYLEYFNNLAPQDINLVNLCHSLKGQLSHSQAKLVIENLFHLAFLHGLEIEERREVDRIAGKLQLSPADIRFALMNAKKKAER
ncbi:MAG: TerB family tellurite resistance protein [Calditrichaeota bacterium]|nr:TerB family tellurite resistance protein [Calditrichota bacterium]